MAKPLVFVHGFACTHADWQPLAAHFGADHPTFAPDLRGHGATHARPEDCSIETYGADIAALLEGKDLEGAVLIGHSMGCRVVLQALLNAPQRVARWDTANMQAALAAVKIPMLVVQSTRMLAGGKRAALKAGETSPWLDLVRSNVPQAGIEIIRGVGHFPQLEVPQVVIKYLEGFIQA